MLVLSRQRDEAVVIGEGANQVQVTVVDIRGDKVRLGFKAPVHLSVHREEVLQAILRDRANGTTRKRNETARATVAPARPGQGKVEPSRESAGGCG